MKNKRGDIPVTILVIGVVAICGLAIISFLVSKSIVNKEPLGVGLMEEINSDIEKFYFYQNLGDSKEVAAQKIGASDYEIVKEDSVLEVRYPLT